MAGFVREFRPQLLATGDRSLVSARLVFVSSDRSWPQHVPESLTRAIDLPLVVANGLKPVTAVTSYEHRPRLPPPECGPKWRTFAVTSHERNQMANKSWRRRRECGPHHGPRLMVWRGGPVQQRVHQPMR